MSIWLLFLNKSDQGLAVRVDFPPHGLTTSPAGKHPIFDADITPDDSDDLWESVQRGVNLSGSLLWREGYLDQSITLRFRMEGFAVDGRKANKDTLGIIGASADLLFALAAATRFVPLAGGYPALAATGALEEDDRQVFVRWVKGVPDKIDAALDVLPRGGLIFYPNASFREIGDTLHEKANDRQVRLIPVDRLEEAFEHLGLKIEGIYTRPPYLGLQSFGYAERGIFCGRDAEIAELQSLLLQREQLGKPGALILAASGAGKSSLAQAGLLPALEKAGWRLPPANADQPPDPQHLALAARPVFWAATWKLPQLASERNAAGLLRAVMENWAAVPEFKRLPPVDSLLQLADAYTNIAPKQRRFLWLIDQLEELFTLDFPAEAIDAFADFLQRLQTQGVWLVAMLRNDFYPHYQQHAPKTPGQARLLDVFGGGHYDLLKPADLMFRRIVQQPADKAGLEFETAADGRNLADQIVQDLRDGGVDALPLLQFALKEVWKRRKNGEYLTFQAYDGIGGLHGAIGNSADSVYRQLKPSAQAVLPKLLWDLAIPRETHGEAGQHLGLDYVAQAINLADYPEGSDGRELIDAFADRKARLLVYDVGKVRVAHEALFRHWQTAQGQLARLREDMAVRERVQREYERWRSQGNSDDFLLMPVMRLAEGEALLKQREEFLDADLAAYIRASSEAEHKRQRGEAERVQKEQDLIEHAKEQAEQLAQQQTQLAQERLQKAEKLRRKSRQLLVAAVVSLAAAGVAGWYWQEATTQTQATEKKRAELAGTLASSDFSQAAELMQRDKPREALAYLARAIRTRWDTSHGILANSILVSKGIPISSIFAHLDTVDSVAFSPDGRRVVTASNDNTARIWDAQTGKLIGVPLQHQDTVWSAAFSPDGRRVVTASWDKTARVWDAQTGLPLGALLRHEDMVHSAAFSPDGRRVVTASEDNTARVWDAQTGQPLGAPLQHQGAVLSATFSPDGRRVLTGSRDCTARIWNAQTSAPLEHEDKVMSVTFSPDGRRVLTVSADNTARIWDAQTGRPLGEPLQHQDYVQSATFSPDGRRVVTASSDNTARVWDAQTGRPLGAPLQHQGAVLSATFSPDGRRVATASKDGVARVWDAQTGQPLGTTLHHQSLVSSVAFSPDGRRVATASDDKTVRIWDAQTSQPLGTPLQHQGAVLSASFSPDGRRIATASLDITTSWNHTTRIWDAQIGQPLGSPLQHEGTDVSATFSPDGRWVVTASDDHTARVWDTQTGQSLGVPLRHQDIVRSAAFSPDGRRVATASEDSSARVWDAQTGQPLGEPLRHQDIVRSAAFSPDGRRVATASKDSTARVWDAQTGQPLGEPLRHQGIVWSAVFSPDGRQVLTTSSDSTAHVWDVQTSQPLGMPLQHRDSVLSATFSPDGGRVLTASLDYTARVWDAQTGQSLGAPLRHEDGVNSAAFSPDGRRVVTASSDHTARLWDAQTGLPLGVPLRHEDKVMSAEFSPDGRRVVTASDDHTARIWEIGNMPYPGLDFAVFLESIAGYRLNDAGGLTPIPAKSQSELRAWLATAQDLRPEARHLIEWLLSDPLERTVTPHDKQTTKERVQQLIGLNTVASLNEALDYWPGHPLALAKLAAATLCDGTPEQRQANFPSARLWASLALKYAPEDAAVRAIAEPESCRKP